MDSYWTSVSLSSNPKMAYETPFFYGGSMARDKTIDTFVRLVRSADQRDTGISALYLSQENNEMFISLIKQLREDAEIKVFTDLL